MAIRRGTLYATDAFKDSRDGVIGYLVLSNDRWNTSNTQEAAGALVYDKKGVARVALSAEPIFVGELIAIPKTELGNPIAQLSSAELRPVEEVVCRCLGLRELLGQPPAPPPTAPGAIDYPVWSRIYYAGRPVGTPPQTKRRVAASVDGYNKAMGGAVVIRTTTQGRPGPGFPQLSDGTIAVAMLPSFFFTSYVRCQPRDPRPQPSQLFLPDMALIAAGVVDALELRELI